MISIDSKLWSVRAYNDSQAQITQRATGSTRYIARNLLPHHSALAAMSERRFDAIVRDLFSEAAP